MQEDLVSSALSPNHRWHPAIQKQISAYLKTVQPLHITCHCKTCDSCFQETETNTFQVQAELEIINSLVTLSGLCTSCPQIEKRTLRNRKLTADGVGKAPWGVTEKEQSQHICSLIKTFIWLLFLRAFPWSPVCSERPYQTSSQIHWAKQPKTRNNQPKWQMKFTANPILCLYLYNWIPRNRRC